MHAGERRGFCGVSDAWCLCVLMAIVAVMGCKKSETRERWRNAGDRVVDAGRAERARRGDAGVELRRRGRGGDEDARGCLAPGLPVVAAGWVLRGYHPGPGLEDVVAVGRRRRVLLATTKSAVCVSRDGGETWAGVLQSAGRLTGVKIESLEHTGAVVVIADGSDERHGNRRVFVSRDEGENWDGLVLPTDDGGEGDGGVGGSGESEVRVFTDGERRVFVTTPRRLWMSVDLGNFEGAVTLPGVRVDGVDVCGMVLVGDVKVDAEAGVWHQSEDWGKTWRPLRLGRIGLEGGAGMLRCLGWRGGIEAGRPPLPGWWSFDQGRTWEPARYDREAVRWARELRDDPTLGGEAPRCSTAPTGRLVCMQEGRLVLPETGGEWNAERREEREVRAPGGCEHLRMLDDRRVLAFGPSCGVYLSSDLGGRWRALATNLEGREAAEESAQTGGMIDGSRAWRLDGGLWWTEDGGESWRLVPSVNGRQLERGVFVDVRRGVFSQRDGWVSSTRDGGRTWTYVLRGAAERIASAGRRVMLTTANRVLLSQDGGQSWRANGTIPAGVPLDPVLVIEGDARRFDPGPGLRAVQRAGRVMVSPRAGEAPVEVLRGLPRGWELLSAFAEDGAITRVLFSGGAVLRRERPHRERPHRERPHRN